MECAELPDSRHSIKKLAVYTKAGLFLTIASFAVFIGIGSAATC